VVLEGETTNALDEAPQYRGSGVDRRPATIVAPVAVANVSGCLPLNGTQLTANSHEDTNYLGITYDSNVTYWYQDGAVNWHRTVDGGEFNLTHTTPPAPCPPRQEAPQPFPAPTAAGEAATEALSS
jgi:hypothetical protein